MSLAPHDEPVPDVSPRAPAVAPSGEGIAGARPGASTPTAWRIPRSRGLRLAGPQLVRVGLTGALLAIVIIGQRPCADSVSRFVTSFGEPADAGGGAAMPRPGSVDLPGPGAADDVDRGSAGDYEVLRPDMSEAELAAAIARARERAAARAAAAGGTGRPGSAAGTGGAGSGRTTDLPAQGSSAVAPPAGARPPGSPR
jgi:hypothetical protein